MKSLIKQSCEEINRLQPKQLLYNKPPYQNLINNISKAFTNFMDILFSDEHVEMTISIEPQKKKELRRRPLVIFLAQNIGRVKKKKLFIV